MLPCRQRGQYLLGVQVMASSDDYGIDAWVLDELGFVGSTRPKTEFALDMLRVRSSGRANRDQRGIGGRLQRGNECARGKDSRAEQSNGNTAGGGRLGYRSSRLRDESECARVVFASRVLNYHAQKWLTRLLGNQVVSTLGALDGETVRDQGTDVNFFLGEELHERFHVTGFGPTHVADRIVTALLLVGCVVTTRPVGARNAEVELFLVVRFTLDVHAYGTDSDDNRAVARNGAGQIDRVAAGRFGSDKDTVNACSVRCLYAKIAER